MPTEEYMEFNFGENQTLDSLDTVPDNFKGAYVEQDGKFTVNPAIAGLTGAFDGVNKALKSERVVSSDLRKQKDANAAVKEVLGFDSLDAAKAKFDELGQQVADKAKVDPAKIKAEIEATFQTERDGFKTTLAGMETTLFEHLVGNTARAALAEHKGSEALLLPHIERQSKVVKDETSGKYVVRVVDADGQYRGNGQGGFMGVSDLVGELKKNKDFGLAFQSDAQGGTGPTQQPASRGAQQQHQQREQQNGRSSTDKISAGMSRLHQEGSIGAA